jgi:transcriptional regulator NrdR family protein
MSCNKCPSCQGDSQVVFAKDVGQVALMRRRRCIKCSATWHTYEITTHELHELRAIARRSSNHAGGLARQVDHFLTEIGESEIEPNGSTVEADEASVTVRETPAKPRSK